jgi:hypothetical protein
MQWWMQHDGPLMQRARVPISTFWGARSPFHKTVHRLFLPYTLGMDQFEFMVYKAGETGYGVDFGTTFCSAEAMRDIVLRAAPTVDALDSADALAELAADVRDIQVPHSTITTSTHEDDPDHLPFLSSAFWVDPVKTAVRHAAAEAKEAGFPTSAADARGTHLFPISVNAAGCKEGIPAAVVMRLRDARFKRAVGIAEVVAVNIRVVRLSRRVAVAAIDAHVRLAD